MISNTRLRMSLAIASVTAMAATAEARAEQKLALDHVVITCDPGQPAFVQHAVEDLAGYLKDLTGRTVPISTSADKNTAPVLAVGTDLAGQYLGESPSLQDLGKEGYILKTLRRDGHDTIVAAGADPRGTMAGVYAFMRRIRVEGQAPFLAAPVDLRGKPAFAIRGMHFNGWPFKYPHSFRRWSEEEWKRYLDILAYQGVNLFYFWPFMEIMPLPLSAEDQAYLEECRRIIDYARTRHGMEVWIMQCTNRVAKDNCGVADPKARPYWRPAQEDLNPADPKNVEAILASRETLYRALNNADGFCNIDSDPGWCPNCPLEDYLKMLKHFRSLLDRCTLHGKQTKLMSWMWMGWGRTGKEAFSKEYQERTLRELNRELHDSWGPVAGNFGFLDLCRKQGLLGRTVLLPYGLIEDEPSYPQTNVSRKRIREAMAEDLPRNLDMPGAIGNVQTPLLQLPTIYYFTNSLWNPDYSQTSDRDMLLELAGHLYPEHAQLVADCYLGLRDTDWAKVTKLADQLDDLVRNDRLGRLGIIGRKLFPDHRVVAQALVLQLRLKAAQERLFQAVTPDTPQAECSMLLAGCLDAFLAWDLTHGWHDFWGWENIQLVPLSTEPRFGDAIKRIARCLKDKAAVDTCLSEVGQALTARYDARIVRLGCIDPLTNAILGIMANPAAWAQATASVAPEPNRYPPSAANDGQISTQYWPGALVTDNTQWLQLTWDRPQEFRKVVVRFLQHPSMHGRTIHLQHETAGGKWIDLATAVVPADPAAPHALATFQLPAPVKVGKIRIVNLLDVYEVEIY